MWARLRGDISVEQAILLLLGAVFAISSHVFPWYVTALLPWIAGSIRPLRLDRWSMARGAATGIAWYVACTGLCGYTGNVTRVNTAPWWAAVFFLGHGWVGIGIAAGVILLLYVCFSLPVVHTSRSWLGGE